MMSLMRGAGGLLAFPLLLPLLAEAFVGSPALGLTHGRAEAFALGGACRWAPQSERLGCGLHLLPSQTCGVPSARTASQRQGRVQRAAKAQELGGDLEVRGEYKIHYRVFKPAPGGVPRLPIVVLHGGPGVPCDYLLPLSALASDPQSPRAVYFYDQLGCGLSDEPPDFSFYSPRQTAEDCATVLQHFADNHGLLNGGGFHLYGQSWGGCVAAETVLALHAETKCMKDGLASVVFSGTPASPMRALEDAGGLIAKYAAELESQTPEEMGMRADWPRTEEFIKQWQLQVANERFATTHNLRMDKQPKGLSDAYSKQGTIWRGAKAISDWSVSSESLKKSWPAAIPALVARGEHDFVGVENSRAFVEGIPLAEYAEMRGLSHQAHLEDTNTYLKLLDGYFRRVEDGRVQRG